MVPEVIMQVKVRQVMETITNIGGLEERVVKELVAKRTRQMESDLKKARDDRLTRSKELETSWRNKRLDDEIGAMSSSLELTKLTEVISMDWEEDSVLEELVETLGLELEEVSMDSYDWDLEEEWLTEWVMTQENLADCANQLDRPVAVEASMEMPMDWLEVVEESDKEENYMTWLMAELKSMNICNAVLDTMVEEHQVITINAQKSCLEVDQFTPSTRAADRGKNNNILCVPKCSSGRNGQAVVRTEVYTQNCHIWIQFPSV